MRPKRLYCLAVILVIATSASAQTVWKWTDEHGVVHFSDHPDVPNAVEVNVNAQTYSAEESKTRVAAPTQNKPAAAAPGAYQSLQIASPVSEATLQAGAGPVSVQLNLQPGLKPGDHVQLFLDGKMVGDSSSLSFSLPDVERGAHSLQARVVGASSVTAIVSSTVTFHIQQPSVLRKQR